MCILNCELCFGQVLGCNGVHGASTIGIKFVGNNCKSSDCNQAATSPQPRVDLATAGCWFSFVEWFNVGPSLEPQKYHGRLLIFPKLDHPVNQRHILCYFRIIRRPSSRRTWTSQIGAGPSSLIRISCDVSVS